MCHTWGMSKRPRDPNQLAKQIVDIAIGDSEDTVSESKRTHKTQGAPWWPQGRKSKGAASNLGTTPRHC